MSSAPDVSVVIPVYNEELNLPLLFSRLYPVLDGLGRTYEVIFTNDGSMDTSLDLLPDAILTPDGTPAFTKAGMLKTIELASSPAYRVAAALELAVAQRAAVWRDHPDYRDWADEDQATPGA